MPKVEIEVARAALAASLPVQARWLLGGSPLIFKFSRAHSPLGPAADELVDLPELPADPATLFIFGEQDYADGGRASPYLVIDGISGAVFALDIESAEHPLRFINSSTDQFIRSFAVLDAELRHAGPMRNCIVEILMVIDPDGFSRSEWSAMLDALRTDETAP
jgi:hypothetical protein